MAGPHYGPGDLIPACGPRHIGKAAKEEIDDVDSRPARILVIPCIARGGPCLEPTRQV